MTMYMVAGTQAAKAADNQLLLLKTSHLTRTKQGMNVHDLV